jgi:hypothetical protein
MSPSAVVNQIIDYLEKGLSERVNLPSIDPAQAARWSRASIWPSSWPNSSAGLLRAASSN